MVVKCDKHGIEYDNELTVGGLTIHIQCPECTKERDALIDAELASKDELIKANEVSQEYQDMNIEPAFYGASLENFVADTKELQVALDAVRRLLAGQIQQLVMLGKTGTGKTHLAVSAVKERHGKIYTMYEIATRIRSTYTARSHEDELDVVSELAWLPILAIDELGRTKGSDAETNWLSYIIDKRHARGLLTIIVSNKHLRRDCPVVTINSVGKSVRGCQNCIENYISDDVMSRLFENGVLVTMNGADWRRRHDV
jgi:DNA replication protein DnaC